jgi:hypothetical protein
MKIIIVNIVLLICFFQIGCGPSCPGATVTGVDSDSGVTIKTTWDLGHATDPHYGLCVYDQITMTLTSPSGDSFTKELVQASENLFSSSQSQKIISWFPQFDSIPVSQNNIFSVSSDPDPEFVSLYFYVKDGSLPDPISAPALGTISFAIYKDGCILNGDQIQSGTVPPGC